MLKLIKIEEKNGIKMPLPEVFVKYIKDFSNSVIHIMDGEEYEQFRLLPLKDRIEYVSA